MSDRRVPHRGSRRRGAATVLLTVVLLVLIVASTVSYLLLVATRARRSAYERDAIQALYAAEAGVEVALAALARGDGAREFEGGCGNGRWTASVRLDGAEAIVDAVGHVTPRVGAVVPRKIVVEARRSPGGWRASSWRRVPLSAAETPAARPSPALQGSIGEE